MTFNPEVKINQKYRSSDGKVFVVKSKSDNDEVIVARLKDDGTEDTTFTWTVRVWNTKHLTSTETPPPPPSGNEKLFSLEVNSEGRLIIKNKEGIEVQSSNVIGPQGNDGDVGPQGPQGENGHDGLTWSPRITEDGTSLYFENERGERTSTYRFKGEKGENGSQGPAGPNGKDADLWKPQITPDGRHLFFVNQRGEQSEKFPITGPKGDTGGEGPRGVQGPVGPVYIPNVNADGELSWSNNGEGLNNPTPVNIKGSKGDKGDNGVIFHPVIVDGYLTWTNDQGLPNPEPVKIAGPQGETGERGISGKSAYQIWLDNGNLGSVEDFLASLKGEKGDAAEQITTGYQDVEDYNCPVQIIDTDLIINSDSVADKPEDIIEKRTKEIDELRRQGHTPEMQRQKRVGWFKKAMWWCAGADRDLLTMCPGDHSKYVGVGTVILFTALMAFFSSFIAMRLVFGVSEGNIFNGGSLAAFVFAIFWGSMIFFLDRFITNTMYSDGKVTISKKEFICGLPRIIIAIFLGIVISAPLEIQIFSREISYKTEQLKEQKLRDTSCDKKNDLVQLKVDLQNKNKERQEIESNITNKEDIQRLIDIEDSTHKAKYEKIKNDNPYPKEPKISREEAPNAWKLYNDRCDAVDQKRQREREVEDTRHEKEKDKLSSVKIGNLGINSVQEEIGTLESKIETTKNSIQKDLDDAARKFDSNKDGLGMKLEALHAIAMEGYVPWFYEDKSENNRIFAALDFLLHEWWWFLFNSSIGLIMLLFILIDISPVLYKMMLADGNYDNYLHQEKLLAQDKIRLSLSKMLKKLDDSELKRVAPFIMGDIYEKMAGDSYVFKTEEEFREELADYESVPWWKRLWPISWFSRDKKPTAPVIIMEPKEPTQQQQRINDVNQEVFEEVLDMKRRIILASYRRWYKRQHDNIIGERVDDENAGREAFDEPTDADNA